MILTRRISGLLLIIITDLIFYLGLSPLISQAPPPYLFMFFFMAWFALSVATAVGMLLNQISWGYLGIYSIIFTLCLGLIGAATVITTVTLSSLPILIFIWLILIIIEAQIYRTLVDKP